jgi:hypothetical protein
MDVSGRPHAPATLSPVNELPMLIREVASKSESQFPCADVQFVHWNNMQHLDVQHPNRTREAI